MPRSKSLGTATADNARSGGLLVTLMGCGTQTQGMVHCHQLKSLDWRARKAQRKEAAPLAIIKEVQGILDTILTG